MKMLMIYCDRFAYKPTIKTLDIADENAQPASFEKVQTAFLQVEEKDEDRETDVTKKNTQKPQMGLREEQYPESYITFFCTFVGEQS